MAMVSEPRAEEWTQGEREGKGEDASHLQHERRSAPPELVVASDRKEAARCMETREL